MNRRPFESRRSRRRPDLRVSGWVEMLEPRIVMASPVIEAIADVSLPAGKTLFVPVRGSDSDGDTLSYTVQSSSPGVQVSARAGHPFLRITVAGFGVMEFQLFDDLAPETVDTITGLVESNFYDGLIFHRVVPGFVIQGGDPAGNGTGGPGFQFDDEFHPDAIFTGDAQLAMANSGKDTNGSQFFITIGPERHLDFNHTLFGQLVRGRDVLTAINAVPTNASGKPLTDVVISDAAIVPNTTDTVLLIRAPAGSGSSAITVAARDPGGETASRSFTAQFAPDLPADNNPPILGPVGDQTAVAGFPRTIPLTSIDLESDPVEYSATIVDNPAAATVTVLGSNVIVQPTPGFLGTFRLRVGVKQVGAIDRGAPGSDPFDYQTIDVQVVPLTIGATGVPLSAVAGVSTTGVVARFTPNEGAATDFSAVVTFDDGTTAPGTIVANDQGGFDVGTTHTYTTVGTFPIEVTITGVGGVTDTATTTATVAPLTIGATGVPLSAVATTPVTAVVARFTPNGGAATDFSAVVTFDDGTTTPGTIVANDQGGFDVGATHTYTTMGSFPIEVTITGVGGVTATATTTATVAPQPGARLTIELGTSAERVTVGQDLTYTVTISSTGVAPALGLSLSFLMPSGVTFLSSTVAPTSVSTGGDVVTIPLGNLAVGASRSLQVVVRPTASGTISSTAFVTSSIDPTVAATRSTMTIVQAAGGIPTSNPEFGPQVLNVSRQGNRIDLTFGSDLDPARAEDVRNYVLAAPGRDGRHGTRDDVHIPITASYDAGTRVVTLETRSRRRPIPPAFLRVRSGGAFGLIDTQGRPLDGDRDGLPGGDFRFRLRRAKLPRRDAPHRASIAFPAGPAALFAGNRVRPS